MLEQKMAEPKISSTKSGGTAPHKSKCKKVMAKQNVEQKLVEQK